MVVWLTKKEILGCLSFFLPPVLRSLASSTSYHPVAPKSCHRLPLADQGSIRSEMLQLPQLSGELIAQILQYNGLSTAVLALWKCGDLALNSKIAASVYEINLEDICGHSTSRYPKMLSSLRHLRKLSLKRPGYIAPPAILAEELQKLSPTLIELEIRTFGAILALRQYPSPLSGETIPNSFSEHGLGSTYTYWNIGAAFPRLRKLVVSKGPAPSFAFTPQLREILPSSLEHLELLTFAEEVIDLAECLPDSLLTFRMKSLPTASTWPPNLTRLENTLGQSDSNTFAHLITKSELPRTLKTMPIIALSKIETAQLLKLPPALERLELPRIRFNRGIDWKFPAGLTQFIARELSLNATILSALPPTINEIHVADINWTTLDAFTSSSLAAAWPKSLRRLRFDSDLHSQPGVSSIGANAIIKSLPTEFTHLAFPSLSRAIRPVVWPEEPLILHWTYSFLNLRKLVLNVITIPIPLVIGPHLRKLKVHVDEFDVASFVNVSSAPSLTCFGLHAKYRVETFSHEEVLNILPVKALMDLRLGLGKYPRNKSFTPAVWSRYLPSSLTRFDLDFGDVSSLPVPSSILPVLPRKLNSVSLFVSALPSAEDILSMPCHQSLVNFDLYTRDPITSSTKALGGEVLAKAWPFGPVLSSSYSKLQNHPYRARRIIILIRDQFYPDPRVTGEEFDIDFGV